MNKNWKFKRGDIYLANMGVTVGSEQTGIRPVIVVSNNVGNDFSPNVTVVPLTTKDKKMNLPTHYQLESILGLQKASMVLAENVVTISKKRILRYLGKIDGEHMLGVEEAIKNHLGFELSKGEGEKIC